MNTYRRLAPYFGVFGAILAAVSWAVSNGLERNADHLASNLAIAYEKQHDYEQFNLVLMHLNNLEKSSHSLNAQLTSIHPPLPADIDPRVREFFVYTAEGGVGRGLPWDDIAAGREQSRQLQTYVDQFELPSCPALPAIESTMSECVARHLQRAPVGFGEGSGLLWLRQLESGVPQGKCLASKAAAAQLRFSIVSSATAGVSEAFQAYSNKFGLDGIALSNDPKNLKKISRASPAYHLIQRISDDCLDHPLTASIQQIERVSQDALDYANTVSLPQAKRTAVIAGWIAAVFYIFAATLGVLGKYEEIRTRSLNATNG
jgi:hypothetical protein